VYVLIGKLGVVRQVEPLPVTEHPA
jgi:hypothetical protein